MWLPLAGSLCIPTGSPGSAGWLRALPPPLGWRSLPSHPGSPGCWAGTRLGFRQLSVPVLASVHVAQVSQAITPALPQVLIDWINDVLVEERIIVKQLEEDLYDGQVLQKLLGESTGRAAPRPPPGKGPGMGWPRGGTLRSSAWSHRSLVLRVDLKPRP